MPLYDFRCRSCGDEFERLVRHFLDNLKRFERGEALVDRID